MRYKMNPNHPIATLVRCFRIALFGSSKSAPAKSVWIQRMDSGPDRIKDVRRRGTKVQVKECLTGEWTTLTYEMGWSAKWS